MFIRSHTPGYDESYRADRPYNTIEVEHKAKVSPQMSAVTLLYFSQIQPKQILQAKDTFTPTKRSVSNFHNFYRECRTPTTSTIVTRCHGGHMKMMTSLWSY